MSMIAVAVIGAGAAGYGAYANSQAAKKSGYETDPYGALNPYQKAMLEKLGPYLTNKIGSEPELYSGDYTADMTQAERDAIARQSRLAALNESWASDFTPGKINSETDANELRNLNDQFYGNGAAPGAKALAEEQYNGSGGYWGSARANGVMDAYNNTVVNPYQNWRSQALQNSYTNALNYGQGSTAINQANQTMQAVPRLIEQYGLDKQYEEWVRGQESNKGYIDQALAFLGLSTGTTTYNTKTSTGGQVASAVGSGLLSFASSGYGGGTTTAAPAAASTTTSPTSYSLLNSSGNPNQYSTNALYKMGAY